VGERVKSDDLWVCRECAEEQDQNKKMTWIIKRLREYDEGVDVVVFAQAYEREGLGPAGELLDNLCELEERGLVMFRDRKVFLKGDEE